MKPFLILATAASFAAACNKQLAASGEALDLIDVSLTPDKGLAAMLVPVPGRHPSAGGSLHTVQVLKGEPAKVEADLAKLIEDNRCVRPLKLLVVQGAPEKEVAKDKKPKLSVILVVGVFQP